MFDADVNYLAVVLAGLAAQPLGFLWYGSLFGSAWMRARGYSKQDLEGGHGGSLTYVVPLVAALVIAYGFARLTDMVDADSVGDAVALAAFVWISFAAPVTAMQINFSPGTANKLAAFAIEGGYYLTSFVVAGAIIGAFQ